MSSGRRASLRRMTIKRLENVGIVDREVGLQGVRTDIAMLQTPDGHGRLELMRFHTQQTREVVPVQDVYRLCHVRGPDGIIVMLAEELG